MKEKIIPFLHQLVSNLEFTRNLPQDFGKQKIVCTPRVNLNYIYRGFDSVDSELLTVARQYVKKGDMVWDIGANIGVFSFASAYRAGSTGRVLAVDADDRHTQLLRKSSFKLLPQSASVDVINAAISNQLGVTELNVVETGNTKNYIVDTSGSGKTGEVLYKKHVVSVTLDWLLSYFPQPNLIKIDVEGAELLVLQGANQILAEIRPLFYLESQDYNQKEVTKLLKSFDYKLYEFDKNYNKLVEIAECNFNTLAYPQEKIDFEQNEIKT